MQNNMQYAIAINSYTCVFIAKARCYHIIMQRHLCMGNGNTFAIISPHLFISGIGTNL